MTVKRSMASGWEKWDGYYRAQLRPVMDWMVRNARLEPGKVVLDLATGTGRPAITVADRVRPGGRVVGIDHDPEMLAACRRLAQHAGVDNLELQQMEMQSLNFPEASFDAVTFGFGLMFARDPVKVMLEVRRVLKPGGRFALAVWDEPKRNSFFTTGFAALDALGSPAPDAKGPGAFRLAPNGELQSVLRAAGFPDFTVEAVPMNIESASLDQHWEMLVDVSSLVAEVLADKPAEDVAKAKAAVFEALAPHLKEGRVRLQATALCATAVR